MTLKSAVIVGITVTAVAASTLVTVVTLHRWQRDIESLQSLQDEHRKLKAGIIEKETENTDLRNENRALVSELEHLESVARLEQPRSAGGSDAPSTPTPSDESKQPAEMQPGETTPGDRPRRGGRRGLSENQEPMTADQIREALKTDQPWARHRLIDQIEKLPGRDEQLSLIREILTMTGEDQGLKSRSLRLLDKIGGPESAALALEYLQSNPRSWASRQAADIISRNADHTMTNSLYAATAGESESLKRGAALALKRLGDPAPLNKYVETAAVKLNDQDGAVRGEAVRAIASIQDPVTIPYLAAALKDSDSRTRGLAAWGLGNLKDKSALPYLEPLLQDENPLVKEAAGMAVKRINNPDAKQPEVPQRLRDLWRQ